MQQKSQRTRAEVMQEYREYVKSGQKAKDDALYGAPQYPTTQRHAMKTLALLLLSAALSASVRAGEPSGSHEHAGHGAAARTATTSLTEGTVKKVDKEAGKLTISHGPLVNLDMPAMTMDFYVKDAAFLDVPPGQKIRFSAENANVTVVVLQAEH